VITACHRELNRAYDRIGSHDDDGAAAMADRLAQCGVRASCPYDAVCARRVAALRRDIRAVTAAGGPALSEPWFGRDGAG
jgi:hypothetical protein